MAAPNRVRARSTTNIGASGPKFDPSLAKQVCDLVQEGMGFDTALNYLGVHTFRFWRWITKGEAYWKGGQQPAKHAPYGQFVMDLRKAHATYIYNRTKQLDTPTWFRNLAILERKDRKNWARREPQGGSLENYDPNEKFL